jgi:DNA-binding protein HU-beta
VAKATLAKGSRISGGQRTTLASQYAKRYAGGESIRKIAEDAGRSYGFVHNVLKESGVSLRGRGGATRGAKKTAPPSTAKKAATRSPAKKTSKSSTTAATTSRKSPAKQTAAKAVEKVVTKAKAATKKTPAKTAKKATASR